MLKKGRGRGSTSRPIFKTRRGVNIKAQILDKEECKSQSQDPGHKGGSNVKAKT
jgi:hypothetical protein